MQVQMRFVHRLAGVWQVLLPRLSLLESVKPSIATCTAYFLPCKAGIDPYQQFGAPVIFS
jgi:hypothetical protein